MKIAVAIIIAVLVIGGGYFLLAKKTEAPVTNPALEGSGTSAPLETTNPNPPLDSSGASSTVVKTVTVTYSDSGFSPKTVTIPVGAAVHFVNASSHGMWVASGVHPTHAAYDGTTLSEHCAPGADASFDACASTGPNGSYDFTFTKAGTFNYHNHVLANDTGTVIVK